ncbi:MULTISPECIES: HhoA/HhoB/HtrA family serine endopeptidase [Nostocales]|uniref:PDZ domain-containing protein n=3 Tax=Nostocales TaxID=1161 RepID=A0A0C1MZ10_9CYAN|nr:HhoA/HhoB/HtrA family serine endopeptidase [Tolypothrix bouteillei]KAF3888953.1 PDZ domain-containing protein [Tolypothrix bouteillei VB521301]
MNTSKHNFQDNDEQNIDSTANRDVNRRNWKKPMSYLGLALVLAGSGITVTGMHLLQPQQAALAVTQNPPDNLATARASNFITEVVDRIGSAVVRIDSSHTVKRPASDIFNDPFFREFFGSEVPSRPSQETVQGVGSGFIMNPNGEILTNAHVVNEADTVTVTLKDGRTFKGQVVGSDPVTDVAVVRIKANNLPTIPLGNSEQLKPGEWAIAIGNPLGLDNTVTEGIISATGRSSSQVGVPTERVNFIQTDAAINPGNSGGPLLNAQGQAIGMNTAIIQNAQGLGFAIPINTAKHIANQLIAKGKVEHAYLGVQMMTLTPELKQQINNNPNAPLSVDESQGVLVVKVVPESPAAKGGIRAGDVIVKVNNESINKADRLQQTVEETSIGSNLQLEIRRNGQTLNLSVKPGALPNTQQEG